MTLRPLRPLVYLWVFPNTVIGLLFVPLALATGGRARNVAGVVEVHGRGVAWVLEHGVPLSGGAMAITLGHVVLGRDAAALDATRDHERVHVRQYERWGPLFIPAYFIAGLLTRLRGDRAYRDNPFEREAYGD